MSYLIESILKYESERSAEHLEKIFQSGGAPWRQ